MKVIFIAGPFRGATPWDVAQNVRRAEEVGLEVAYCGAMPLIPHANTALFDKQLTDDFWLAGTQELLRRCDAVMIVPGWAKSEGTLAEIELANELDIPVFYRLYRLCEWLKEGKA